MKLPCLNKVFLLISYSYLSIFLLSTTLSFLQLSIYFSFLPPFLPTFPPIIACVASVPVGQKSFETIFRKLAARTLRQETEGTQSLAPTFARPVCGKSIRSSSVQQERLPRRLSFLGRKGSTPRGAKKANL